LKTKKKQKDKNIKNMKIKLEKTKHNKLGLKGDIENK
jgi:hypothetical protein